ncbi:MAG: DoxX family membrane protein [Acaryochloridaceae cyanobacterium SU_2_1]|nr:DoxX family membrane protein [Acaryochloridaceae cyanobacterium SU_2_1]
MLEKYLPCVAQGLLSAIFIRAGIGHCLEFEKMQGAIATQGVPDLLALMMAIGGILLLLGGGLSILVGYKTAWGAIAVILFLILATLMFHWQLTDPQEQIQFFKNLGLIGGLLLLLERGAGPLSLDARQSSRLGQD